MFIVNVFSEEIDKTFLISDYDFTNQKYTYDDICKFTSHFKDFKIKKTEIDLIYVWCRDNKIHPLIVFTKMQCENSLLYDQDKMYNYDFRKERAMGYGLHIEYENILVYQNFTLQIYFGISLLRKMFDEYKKKQICFVDGKNITAKNAATYSLYRYTPHYGYADDGRPDKNLTVGNSKFMTVYKWLKNIFY